MVLRRGHSSKIVPSARFGPPIAGAPAADRGIRGARTGSDLGAMNSDAQAAVDPTRHDSKRPYTPRAGWQLKNDAGGGTLGDDWGDGDTISVVLSPLRDGLAGGVATNDSGIRMVSPVSGRVPPSSPLGAQAPSPAQLGFGNATDQVGNGGVAPSGMPNPFGSPFGPFGGGGTTGAVGGLLDGEGTGQVDPSAPGASDGNYVGIGDPLAGLGLGGGNPLAGWLDDQEPGQQGVSQASPGGQSVQGGPQLGGSFGAGVVGSFPGSVPQGPLGSGAQGAFGNQLGGVASSASLGGSVVLGGAGVNWKPGSQNSPLPGLTPSQIARLSMGIPPNPTPPAGSTVTTQGPSGPLDMNEVMGTLEADWDDAQAAAKDTSGAGDGPDPPPPPPDPDEPPTPEGPQVADVGVDDPTQIGNPRSDSGDVGVDDPTQMGNPRSDVGDDVGVDDPTQLGNPRSDGGNVGVDDPTLIGDPRSYGGSMPDPIDGDGGTPTSFGAMGALGTPVGV